MRDKFHGPHRPERTGGLQSSGCATGRAYSEEPILHIEAECDRTGNLKHRTNYGFRFSPVAASVCLARAGAVFETRERWLGA